MLLKQRPPYAAPVESTLAERYEEALSRLLFVVEQGWRCGAVTGPAGIGKSRLLQQVQRAADRANSAVVLVDATSLSRAEFAAHLAAEATGTRQSSSTCWEQIENVLHGWRVTETRSLWVIDQVDDAAEDLSRDILRLIRLLEHAQVAGTVLLAVRAFSDRSALCDAIDLAVSLES